MKDRQLSNSCSGGLSDKEEDVIFAVNQSITEPRGEVKSRIATFTRLGNSLPEYEANCRFKLCCIKATSKYYVSLY